MKTSIEIPTALYRRVKARSAFEGKSVSEIAIGLFEWWLAAAELHGDVVGDADRPAAAAA